MSNNTVNWHCRQQACQHRIGGKKNVINSVRYNTLRTAQPNHDLSCCIVNSARNNCRQCQTISCCGECYFLGSADFFTGGRVTHQSIICGAVRNRLIRSHCCNNTHPTSDSLTAYECNCWLLLGPISKKNPSPNLWTWLNDDFIAIEASNSLLARSVLCLRACVPACVPWQLKQQQNKFAARSRYNFFLRLILLTRFLWTFATVLEITRQSHPVNESTERKRT